MRTDGMGNKFFLIALLCAALGLFLFLRPRLFAPDPPPTLMDRLPDSEILGRFYLLDVAKETSSMLFYNKVPFRDLVSSDFMLSQAKNYGLDIQKPCYFFAEQEGEWGTFIHVRDSSRVPGAFLKLKQFTDMRDTTIIDRKMQFLPEQNIYLFYDKTYLLVYHGNAMKKRLSRAVNARHGDTEDSWQKFNALSTFKNDKLVVFSNAKKLAKYGIEYGVFAHDSDSLSFKLKTYIKASRDLKIRMKESGMAYEQTPSTTKMLDLHLDISEFRKDKQHPLYQWIAAMGRKVGFPTEAFFDAWEGDLSFQQGGTQLIAEEVIETDYNDEFEMVETRTTKMVPVPGFAVLMSVNDKSQLLVSKLFSKGIINKQGSKYRFLFSPPIKMNILPTYLSGYSSDRAPRIATGSSCSGIWDYRGTSVTFRVDSLKKREVYGSIEFPVNRLIRKSKFF